jgi:hypothetical protein
MFRAIDKHSAENERGVVVSDVSRHQIAYQENGRRLILGREGATTPGGGPAQIVYLHPEARWQPPYEADPLTRTDWERIAANVVEAFRALKLETYVERA